MKLKELVNIKIGLPLERKKANLVSVNPIKYRALTLKSFSEVNCSDDLPHDIFLSATTLGSQYLTKEHDVIVRMRSPNNAIFINNRNAGLVVPSIMAIITNLFPNVLDSRYLAYYLNSQQIQNQLLKNTHGTSILLIKTIDLLDLNISLPSMIEQNKMVAYLDSAYQEIDLLHKLIIEKDKLRAEVFETFIK